MIFGGNDCCTTLLCTEAIAFIEYEIVEPSRGHQYE